MVNNEGVQTELPFFYSIAVNIAVSASFTTIFSRLTFRNDSYKIHSSFLTLNL